MASSLLQSWRLPPCIQVPPRCRWKSSLSTRKLLGRSMRYVPVGGERLSELLPSLSVCSRRCLHWTAASSRSFSDQHHSVTVDVGDSPLTFSTGKYVKLADGAILVQSGETSVMVTAVSEKHSSANSNYTPLVVDYRERYSASNKIPRTFFRRELRATNSEVIVSRYIDRSIRPLFPPGYTYNTQVICNMLALDRHNDPEILSINGASAALAVSDIPWNGPIGAVRIGLIDDQFCINPSRRMLNSSKLNLIVASTADRIMMVEGSALEVREEQFCEAINLGFKEAQPLIASLADLQQAVNNQPRGAALNLPPQEIVDLARDACGDRVKSILLDSSHKKLSRDNLLFATLGELRGQIGESHPSVSEKHVGDAFWGHVTKEAMRSVVLDHKTRCDGRGMTELRPISCEVDVFKPLHGCAMFTRGETQVFCSVTFDSLRSAYRSDLLSLILGSKNQTFMVHYEFPPFAINSTGRFLGMDRREIGHGCLAEKALAPLMPANYPFTIRINSQVLESNGSSSMATVCAGSLALFDAGVPMPHAVAGVACGLLTRTKPDSQDIDQYQILSDINGIEDAIGNMDFKMSGTRNGITSIQVDIKDLPGIPFHIFEEAVMQSRDARHSVLDKMDATMSAPREGIKEHGPVYSTIDIPAEKRGRLFGVGGHRVKAIAEETDVLVEGVDEGKVSIFAPSQEAMDEAMEKIDVLLNEETKPLDIPIGSVIEVTIRDLRQYGFIVELAPGVQSLLHIHQFSHDFTAHPLASGMKVGDKVNVKYLGRDSRGHHLISRKALLPAPIDRQQPPPHSSWPLRPPLVSPVPNSGQNTESDRELLSSTMAVTSPVPDTEQKFDRELLNSKVAATFRMPNAEQNSDRELPNSKMATTSHIPEITDRESLNSTMSVTSPMPNAEQNSDRGLLDSKMAATSHMPENSDREFLSSVTDAEQSIDFEPLNSKMPVTSRNNNNMPDPDVNGATEHNNFEVGSVLEGMIVAKKRGGYLLEVAPGVLSLLRKPHAHDIINKKIGQMVKVHVQGYDTRGRLQISRFPPPPLQSPHSPASPLPSSSPSSVTPANQVSEAQEHSSVPDDDSTISIAFKKKFRANLKRLGVRYGEVVQVKIIGVSDNAFRVQLPSGATANLFLSQMSHNFISHPSDSGLSVGDTVPIGVVGPDRQGRPSLSRKVLLPRPPDSGNSDDGTYRTAPIRKRSTYLFDSDDSTYRPEKSSTGFSDSEDSDDSMYRPPVDENKSSHLSYSGDSYDGTYRPAPGEEKSSDNRTYMPAPTDEKTAIIEQPQSFGNVDQASNAAEEGSTSSRPAAVGGDGLVSDGKSDSTAITPQQPSGDADPPRRGILRRLYDRWFDSTATKRGSSSQPTDGGMSDSRTRKQ